jgi:hypothetical protein
LPEQLRIFLEYVLKLPVYFYANLVFNLNIQVDDDGIFGCLKPNFRTLGSAGGGKARKSWIFGVRF